MQTYPLGNTDLHVTRLCFGTSALGSFPAQYGYEVSDEQAAATLDRILKGPVNFVDTSNEYGHGASERRIGQALARTGGLPPDFVLATKVDPLPGSPDFSGDRVRRSVDESLERLGLDHLQLVYLHDPEKVSFSYGVSKDGPLNALISMRNEGVISYIGVAGGPIELMLRYINTDAFDVVLSHNRFTLVDQAATPLMEGARRRGVAFINAAPYGGGILAKGADIQPKYSYTRASSNTLAKIATMNAIAASYSIPLPAFALQFSLHDERVASTVVGITEASRVDTTLELSQIEIPRDAWRDMLAVALA